MDEDEAVAWLAANVSRETSEKLERFIVLLKAANVAQNLVAAASISQIHARHIVDSAQLAHLEPNAMHWVDLGSGAGLPGIVIAIVTGKPMILIEQRRLRVAFLEHVVAELGLSNARVEAAAVERVHGIRADAIVARAFAPLDRLFSLALPLAHASTIWVLPKGRRAKEELASLVGKWHVDARMEQSLTDRDSQIIVAHGVRRWGRAAR